MTGEHSISKLTRLTSYFIYFPLDFTNRSSFTMKQQPRFGAVGWISEAHIHHLLLPVDALRLSTLREHVFHLLG
uniref:Uncharacterized protein n=1 Tax=Candidatus Kentrum sp. UNK TaxID=2126344 RepID=A0A451B063_9GAMM|nr:MAG: hypothetical protein BECKUNK1418H_GA0071006_107615 [Candidatus Kentron sp. UNK]